jgi:hypothetical protein
MSFHHISAPQNLFMDDPVVGEARPGSDSPPRHPFSFPSLSLVVQQAEELHGRRPSLATPHFGH